MKPIFRRFESSGQDPARPKAGSGDREFTNPIEWLLRGGSSSFRRRVIGGASLAVLVLAGISVVLAWRQYDDAKDRALNDLDARVVAVSGVVDTAFGGDIGMLNAVGQSPAVVARTLRSMDAYFRRVAPSNTKLFTGGIGWIDRNGVVRASSYARPSATGNLSGRVYFRKVIATGKPYVSAGLIGRRVKQPIIVIAVPTLDRRGRISGVLAGSILLKTVSESKQALDLGYGDLQIIDREGQLLLSGLAKATNKSLLGQIEHSRSGVLPNTKGLEGDRGHVVAYSASTVPGWVTVIDRPRSTVFAAARHALTLQLASVGAAVLLVFSILGFVVRRARRDTQAQNDRARSWSGLTRTLAAATTPAEVAEALLASLAAGFSTAVAVVAFEDRGGFRVKAASRVPSAGRVVADRAILEKIAPIGREGPRSMLLEQPTLRDVHAASGRRFRSLHSLPIHGEDGEPVGTITLLSAATWLETSEWSLLESFADQAAQALRRAWLFVHEHELAVRLQRSLLPDRLPGAEGIDLAGHYLAGGEAVEVGGDWYDAVQRPDGIIQLCVGDVSGKGIGAATVMGRQRNTFHAYAFDCVSPAEIIRRMLRHMAGDEMITLACVSLDPYAGQLTYACAGHPPPLLLDRDSGAVTRLDGASAPPLGVAESVDIVEAQIRLPARSVLAMYTDGLIERRGANIEEGIDLLGLVIAAEQSVTPDVVVGRVSDAIGAPSDDVALLLATLDVARTGFDLQVPAEPASLPAIRRRLREWLLRRGLDQEQVGEMVVAASEACNNAIEHAYPDAAGEMRLVVSEGESDTLRIVVEDQGSWKEETPTDERGRGILLMRNLMHSAEIETGEFGTRVTLERRLHGDPVSASEQLEVGPLS